MLRVVVAVNDKPVEKRRKKGKGTSLEITDCLRPWPNYTGTFFFHKHTENR